MGPLLALVQLPDRHLNAFGWMSPTQPLPGDTPAVGGWIGDADGTRALRSATCGPRLEEDQRTAMAFDMTFETTDGEVLTVRTGRKHAHTRNGLMRDENDAEVRLDCHEPFFDFEVLEPANGATGWSSIRSTRPGPGIGTSRLMGLGFAR